jgi:polysaccharide deacetylase 2 family uncharacterized protein YibQ
MIKPFLERIPSITLPKIPMMWAVAMMLACVIGAGLGFVLLSHTGTRSHHLASVEVPLVSAHPVTHVKSPPPVPEVKQAASPVVDPAHGTKTTEKTPPETVLTSPSLPEKPYLKEACVERIGGADMLLPIVSKDGARPFDVYQNDFLPDPKKTQLTVIVSELGLNQALFDQVVAGFPPSVSCAFFANRTLSQEQNNKAREGGRETLLMLPLEPMDYPRSDPGMNTLLTNMPGPENKKRFESNLSQFTGYMAVMPYGGDRFCRVKQDFQPILREVQRRGIGYFEPRVVRSMTMAWKPEKFIYAKGGYDIVRGASADQVKDQLASVEKDLAEKKSVILTVQADKVTLEMVQKWLPTVMKDDVVLAPLSAQMHD